MQRHRKKDRSERAQPTMQKYLHSSAGSPISNSTPVPATNENLYQSCVGGNTGKTGLVCCRKEDLMFHTTSSPGRGSYPEDDPDSIEVYKEHQQQQHDDQRPIEGSPAQEKHFTSKWCAANVSQLPREGGDMTIPLGDALLHHHQQEQQQHLLSCHSNILSGGSAEYSYAYCEPILLQRPNGDNSIEQQLHTPVSTLSSCGSSYCVPVYAQRQIQHPPTVPILQRSFRQPSARNQYQYTYGPTHDSGGSGNNTTTTTLHHHHHHHHHHSNYTLPNTTLGSATTTTTGSLRALFSNIFRKTSSTASPSTDLHSAPFLDMGGSSTLHRSSFGGGTSLLGAERHSFTTCYGTKENIYEDIGSQTGLGALGEESATKNDPPATACVGPLASAPPPLPPSGATSPTAPLTGVAAEWRHVQVQHERVIGELNLSVERLIMPTCEDEYSHQKDQANRYHYYAETEKRDSKQIGQKTFCLPSVGFDSNVAGCGGTNAVSIGVLRVGSKSLFPAPTPTSSLSLTPPTLGVGSERHSPTVSYGKSYGDVDSGISSSSTSGTSYSSSILYRSITNYQQQQQQTNGKEVNLFTSREQHPQRAKHGLFSLHIGSTGSPATMFSSRNRATCCSGLKDQTVEARLEGFGGPASGLTTAAVTNAPDPPPPPDNNLLTYVCPTSDGSYGPMTCAPHSSVSSQTLTSCCFLSDHNLSEREIAMRTFASTHTYHQQHNSRASQLGSTSNGGNFWARFRKLRLPMGSGGKLFSASERQIDTEFHLEDFTGEPMWPEPGPRPVYHHQLLHPTSPPHHLTLLPLEAHMQCALPPTASLNGNLTPTPHQRTLQSFAAAGEPEGAPIHGPNRESVNDGLEIPQQRACSPSTPSSVASTASSGSPSSSSVPPSSPMSPMSSSSCSLGAKHSDNENA